MSVLQAGKGLPTNAPETIRALLAIVGSVVARKEKPKPPKVPKKTGSDSVVVHSPGRRCAICSITTGPNDGMCALFSPGCLTSPRLAARL